MPEKKHIFSCPVGAALDVFAGRWKPEILWHLKGGCMRFNQMRRTISDVSQKMLTQQLRELERDGLIIRTPYPEIPPRVEYKRTKLADTLEPIFKALIKWDVENGKAVIKAQKKYRLLKK